MNEQIWKLSFVTLSFSLGVMGFDSYSVKAGQSGVCMLECIFLLFYCKLSLSEDFWM